MKKYLMPLLKLLFIMLVWGFLYTKNSVAIHTIVNSSEITNLDKVILITRQILGSSYSPPINPDKVNHNIGTNSTTATVPRQLSQEVLNNENYLHAKTVAEQFNQKTDFKLLNDNFTKLINNERQNQDWPLISVGNHLMEGSFRRANELTDFHYLGPDTVNGGDFRELFDIDQASTRLGENLYELFISADDIHLTTWLNAEIFSEYLYEAFVNSTNSQLYENFNSQYLAVVASPTDYQVDKTPYVRLVVVLVMDTESN